METGKIEPLQVQKLRPDGYMILNGHHRWAAAVRTGVRTLPVQIVSLTQQPDIMDMLSHAKFDKRLTLDLDEIVFAPGKDGETEKALAFPLNRIYKEPLRLGIPELFAFCRNKGYDVWVYSAGYFSTDYIKALLKFHHTKVTGIVTGTARKGPKDSKAKEELENVMKKRYQKTLHIDNEAVTMIDHSAMDFREFPIPGTGVWAAEVMELMEKAD